MNNTMRKRRFIFSAPAPQGPSPTARPAIHHGLSIRMGGEPTGANYQPAVGWRATQLATSTGSTIFAIRGIQPVFFKSCGRLAAPPKRFRGAVRRGGGLTPISNGGCAAPAKRRWASAHKSGLMSGLPPKADRQRAMGQNRKSRPAMLSPLYARNRTWLAFMSTGPNCWSARSPVGKLVCAPWCVPCEGRLIS
jgi:hypothetical protein